MDSKVVDLLAMRSALEANDLSKTDDLLHKLLIHCWTSFLYRSKHDEKEWKRRAIHNVCTPQSQRKWLREHKKVIIKSCIRQKNITASERFKNVEETNLHHWEVTQFVDCTSTLRINRWPLGVAWYKRLRYVTVPKLHLAGFAFDGRVRLH